MKKLILFFIFFSFSAHGYTILIDPGHGGDDDGAKASYALSKKRRKEVREKDLALSISQKIKKLIPKKYNVYLTRTLDRTVSLEKRAEIADKLKADLFISIHVNASTANAARGFETYYLDNHDDAAVKKVEQVENKDLKGDELIVNQILTDLVIERTVDTSKKLAASIHKNVQSKVRKFKMKDRGIKPGLFYVLALAKRPAVLLEMGFMSNPKELKRINSNSFQNTYAKAVAKGIVDYLKALEKEKPALF